MKILTAALFFVVLAFVKCSNNKNDMCLGNSVRCGVDPCLIYDCPRYPLAVCRANYCDGCNAEFFLGDQKVDDCNSIVSSSAPFIHN